MRRAAAALVQRRNETGLGLHFLQLLFIGDERLHVLYLRLRVPAKVDPRNYGIVDNTMSGQRQIAQPVEIVRRKHLLGRPPTPIPFGPTRYIHPGLRAQTKNILQRREHQCCSRRPCEAEQGSDSLLATGRWLLHVVPDLLLLRGGQILEPAPRGVVVMRAGVHDAVRRIVVRQVRVRRNRRRRRIAAPECPESGIDRAAPARPA